MRLVYADHHISPFEGSPRAGAAEYVQRGGCYIGTIQEERRISERLANDKRKNIEE